MLIGCVIRTAISFRCFYYKCPKHFLHHSNPNYGCMEANQFTSLGPDNGNPAAAITNQGGQTIRSLYSPATLRQLCCDAMAHYWKDSHEIYRNITEKVGGNAYRQVDRIVQYHCIASTGAAEPPSLHILFSPCNKRIHELWLVVACYLPIRILNNLQSVSV